MTQKIIAYIIIAAAFIFFLKWIYGFFGPKSMKKSSVPDKCKSCAEFKGSCTDPESSSCTDFDDDKNGGSCCT